MSASTPVGEHADADELPRYEQPLLDRENRVVAVVVGWPLGWDARTERATAAMETLYEKLRGYAWPSNRRGDFLTCATGFSYGLGQEVGRTLLATTEPQLTTPIISQQRAY